MTGGVSRVMRKISRQPEGNILRVRDRGEAAHLRLDGVSGIDGHEVYALGPVGGARGGSMSEVRPHRGARYAICDRRPCEIFPGEKGRAKDASAAWW